MNHSAAPESHLTSSSSPAIAATGLSKRYHLGDAGRRAQSFREAIAGLAAAPFQRAKRLAGRTDNDEILWAVRDVDLTVAPGEVVGIVGKNGSGKSTLLKLLARVTAPTEGTATLRGRVGSLLEVGTGFHADLTARENIYLNGALLGMTRAEMNAQLDAIIAFSEVGRFLDTPVKRFSTGMYIRLGFAVAAHIRSDILLVDEVLAVGDAAFQRKCLDKMSALSDEGRTVLFVSHNMGTVRTLCPRVVWLDEGRVRQDGPARDVVTAYMSQSDAHAGPVRFRPPREDAVAAIASAGAAAGETVDREEGEAVVSVEEPFTVWTDVDVRHADTGLSMVLRMYAADGTCVLSAEDTDQGTTPLGSAPAGRHRLVATFPAELFAPGSYRFDFELKSQSNGEVHQPGQTVGVEIRDSGTWRSERAPYRGGGLIAPTLRFRRERASD